MKIGVNVPGADDGNFLGDATADGPDEIVGGDVLIGFEVGDLSQGVDPGIGPSGADEGDGVLEDAASGVSDGFLDGRLARLGLPAVEGAAVVSDDELNGAPHGPGF